MTLSCVDVSVGARIVAVIGLVTSGVVVAQLGAELARGTGDGAAGVLLGLGLDELDSRQRHALHSDAHDHGHDQLLRALARPADGSQPEPFDGHVRDILAAFLAFGVLYLLASGLLCYASLAALRWGALPWLLLHALSVASQVARLVVQVAQLAHEAAHPEDHGAHLHARPMHPHPNHPPGQEAYDEHVRDHLREHEEQHEHCAVVGIAITAAYLAISAYMWLVVLVAHREWSSSKRGHDLSGLGDEGYSLSMTNLASTNTTSTTTTTKESLAAAPSEA